MQFLHLVECSILFPEAASINGLILINHKVASFKMGFNSECLPFHFSHLLSIVYATGFINPQSLQPNTEETFSTLSADSQQKMQQIELLLETNHFSDCFISIIIMFDSWHLLLMYSVISGKQRS